MDALAKGIKPEIFLQAIIATQLDASDSLRDWIDDALPSWLRERNYLEPLRTMVAREMVSGEQEQQALTWLEAARSDVRDLVALVQQDTFYQAYYNGNEMQAALIILWYANRQQTRVRGFNFLIDFQPPWDGSVKDNIYFGQRTPEAAIREFVELWYERTRMYGTAVKSLDAVAAKQKALTALTCNREQNIRLPADLAPYREPFVRHILSLPDGPDTPAFSAADFDYLRDHGQSPEMLSRNEKMFGYRTRMPDGKELVILRDPELDDDW